MSRKFKLEFNNELSKSFAYLLANVNTPEKADLVIVPNLPRSLSVTKNAVMDAAVRSIQLIASHIEDAVNGKEA